jgi:hypothetical protein
MAKRRTKSEMLQATELCQSYLLVTKNDPHKAYNQYIKDHLLSSQLLPHYISGIKDFIKASKQLELDLQEIRQERERAEEHKNTMEDNIERIKTLDRKKVMEEFKKAEGNRKLNLCTLATMLYHQDFRGINQSEIYTGLELLEAE